VNSVVKTAAGSSSTDKDVSCDAGQVATSGGVNMTSPSNNDAILRSLPLKAGSPAAAGDVPNGWRGRATSAFTVYVVCAPGG
jgi:hypothetical protein